MSGHGHLRRWVGGALWTSVLLAGLLFLDRRIIAPEAERVGWQQAHTAPSLLPAYLPATLAWPPAELWIRGGEQPGQWMGLAEEGGARRRLWIGWGELSVPPPLSELEGCLVERAPCPDGWRALSTDLKGLGREVQLISDLGPEEAHRILLGLTPSRDQGSRVRIPTRIAN